MNSPRFTPFWAVENPLDRPICRLYYLIPSLLIFEQMGISCRVAEGRALGRHGNRIGIINLDCQVPTLAR